MAQAEAAFSVPLRLGGDRPPSAGIAWGSCLQTSSHKCVGKGRREPSALENKHNSGRKALTLLTNIYPIPTDEIWRKVKLPFLETIKLLFNNGNYL
jgi:hypothetical protein